MNLCEVSVEELTTELLFYEELYGHDEESKSAVDLLERYSEQLSTLTQQYLSADSAVDQDIIKRNTVRSFFETPFVGMLEPCRKQIAKKQDSFPPVLHNTIQMVLSYTSCLYSHLAKEHDFNYQL